MTARTYATARSETKTMNLKPINTVGGFQLRWRSFGYHLDPVQTQRVIGKHVYIFRTLPDRIDVWRSDMADEHSGYRWTLVHAFPAATALPAPCGHCHSADSHHVQCPNF